VACIAAYRLENWSVKNNDVIFLKYMY
jgi:hypothetical protein